jgi:superfamily II DNA helicase RecQ
MNIKVFNIRLSKEHCVNDQEKMNEFLQNVEVKLCSTNFVTSNSTDYWSAFIYYELKKEKPNLVKLYFNDLTIDEKKRFNSLKQWRNDLATKLNWSAFRICHNSHLISIAKENPTTLYELGKVSQFGTIRAEKYGDDIMAVLNAL